MDFECDIDMITTIGFTRDILAQLPKMSKERFGKVIADLVSEIQEAAMELDDCNASIYATILKVAEIAALNDAMNKVVKENGIPFESMEKAVARDESLALDVARRVKMLLYALAIACVTIANHFPENFIKGAKEGRLSLGEVSAKDQAQGL